MKPKFLTAKDRFLIFVVIVAALLGFLLNSKDNEVDLCEQHIAEQQQSISLVPSVIQLQRQLREKGHNIKADGIVGPNTLKAWDKEICNQHAAKWDFMYLEAEK